MKKKYLYKKEKIKSVYLEKPNKFCVKNVFVEYPDNYICVKIEMATICGSDLKIFSGEMEGINYPLIPGHEWCGKVISAPSNYGDLIGKRIVPDILTECGSCIYCTKKYPNLCDKLEEPGISTNGGFAEYCFIRPDKAYIINDKISNQEAVLIEPLCVALYALQRVPISQEDTILIVGGGGIGQLISQVARIYKPKKIIVLDHHDYRLNLANQYSADLTLNSSKIDIIKYFERNKELKPNIVFEVTGTQSGIDYGMQLVKKLGRIAIVGYSGTKYLSIKTSDIMIKLLDIIGILSPTGTIRQAINLVTEKKVNLQPLVSHIFNLDNFSQAFGTMKSKKSECMRVAIVPS